MYKIHYLQKNVFLRILIKIKLKFKDILSVIENRQD